MSIRCVRLGVLFSLLAIIFGFGMGALFGAAEDSLKGRLKSSGDAALALKYGGSPEKAKAVVDKSWIYLQRAHLHGGAMGAVALALCLLLAATATGPCKLRALAGILAGLGALGYGIYWLLAGLSAPGLGSTGAAKESLEWLALPSSGMAIIGLVLTFVLTIKSLFSAPSAR